MHDSKDHIHLTSSKLSGVELSEFRAYWEASMRGRWPTKENTMHRTDRNANVGRFTCAPSRPLPKPRPWYVRLLRWLQNV